MVRSGSLAQIRRTKVAFAFAALLVALTVTPFTAPFATVDIAELVSTVSHGDKVPSTVLETAIAAVTSHPAAAAILSTAVFLAGLRDASNRLLLTKTIVLRI